MKDIFITILLFGLVFVGCRKEASSPSDNFSLLNPDQKDEAAKIVEEANNDLKKVRTIYKNNLTSDDEVKAAMQNKQVDKVKEISNDLVSQINEGLVSAQDAVKKIKQAEEMNINSTYQDYLRLKRQALEKQIEAFELRRQIAQLIRDSFGGKDEAKNDQVKALFTDKEKQFKKLMDEAEKLSKEANEIYTDSLNKDK